MQSQVQFDRDLLRFLNLAIQIWPSFQSGLKHLHDLQPPSAHSFLPHRDYPSMTPALFQKTIIEDLFDFIMTHDVKEADLYDYLADILELLMMEQQLTGGSTNPASIEFMARYTYQLIQELQQGNNRKLVSFEQDVYLNVKQFQGNVVQEGAHSSDEEEAQQQSQSSQEDSNSEGEEEKKAPEKSAEQLQREKELEDDGWIIVKKK